MVSFSMIVTYFLSQEYTKFNLTESGNKDENVYFFQKKFLASLYDC